MASIRNTGKKARLGVFLNLNYNRLFFFNFFVVAFFSEPVRPRFGRNMLPIALQMKSKLLDLVELKNAGAITEDEFVANKRELFASAVSTSTISTTPVRVRCYTST